MLEPLGSGPLLQHLVWKIHYPKNRDLRCSNEHETLLNEHNMQEALPKKTKEETIYNIIYEIISRQIYYH